MYLSVFAVAERLPDQKCLIFCMGGGGALNVPFAPDAYLYIYLLIFWFFYFWCLWDIFRCSQVNRESLAHSAFWPAGLYLVMRMVIRHLTDVKLLVLLVAFAIFIFLTQSLYFDDLKMFRVRILTQYYSGNHEIFFVYDVIFSKRNWYFLKESWRNGSYISSASNLVTPGLRII